MLCSPLASPSKYDVDHILTVWFNGTSAQSNKLGIGGDDDSKRSVECGFPRHDYLAASNDRQQCLWVCRSVDSRRSSPRGQSPAIRKISGRRHCHINPPGGRPEG